MIAEYRIATIADFLAVPAEKQDECLRDFGLWLGMARDQAAISAGLSEALDGKVTFSTSEFTWIDDGVAGCSALDFREEGGDRVMRFPMTGGAQ